MEQLFETGQWILWFYILVLFPFQLYDFYKQEKRSIISWIYNILVIGVFITYIYGTLFTSETAHFQLFNSHIGKALMLFILIAYIQNIYDLIHEKSKRNILLFTMLTISIVTCVFYAIIN